MRVVTTPLSFCGGQMLPIALWKGKEELITKVFHTHNIGIFAYV